MLRTLTLTVALTLAGAASAQDQACYTRDDLAALRVAMQRSALLMAALHCRNDALESAYGRFVAKFEAELAAGNRRLEARGGKGVNVLMTDLVGRVGPRTVTDPDFCGRNRRTFDAALDPLVTSLDQVPLPYDFSPEIGAYPCPDR